MIEETTRDYLTARADLLRLHALTEAGDDEWRNDLHEHDNGHRVHGG